MRFIGISLFIISLIGFTGCYDVRVHEHPEWDTIFEANSIKKGTFEYYDNNKEIAHYINSDFHKDTFPPGAIFNLFQSIVALDDGTAPTEQFGLLLDSATKVSTSLKEAVAENDEHFFRVLSLKIGEKSMKHALDTVRFGNKNINNKLDSFWYNGDLKISPDEMVGFMKRLYHNTLPFNDRAQRITRGMMEKVESENYSKYFYQANIAKDAQTNIIWVVGFVEQIHKMAHVETKQMQSIPHPFFFTLCYEVPNTYNNWQEQSQKLLTQFLKANDLDK